MIQRIEAWLKNLLQPLAAVLLLGILVWGGTAALGAEERRPPPTARSAGTLGPQVSSRINEVMELREMENYAEALEVMGEIRQLHERGRLNDVETYVMWQFYANFAYIDESYEQALDYYQRMVAVPNIDDGRLEPGFFSIGVLQMTLEDYRAAIEAFERYLELAENPDSDVYFRVALSWYQLEGYPDALAWLQRSMEMQRAGGEQPDQNAYTLLRSIHFNLEDYESFRRVTREMIVLFDDPDDWTYLANANGQLERLDEQAQVWYVAGRGGYLDDESEVLQLAFAHSLQEDPYGAAKVLARGMERGVVEESAENLSYLAQFYMVAREDALAAPPMARAAQMSGDPDLFVRLASIYMNMYDFENAVRAYHRAFEAGDVERPGQVLLGLATAFWRLNRHDEALEAARQAATYEESRESAQSYIAALERDRELYRGRQAARRELAEYF